jgi:hypothetical protein
LNSHLLIFVRHPRSLSAKFTPKGLANPLPDFPMSKRETSAANELEVNSLLDLLQSQDEQMRSLFAKAINLYVAPDADQMSDNEKVVRLREAIEQMLT